MTQWFKENDQTEKDLANCLIPTLDALGVERNAFYNGADECFKLGEVLFDLQRDPVADVISREVFISSFFAIHALFTRPGTFEFYLEMFRAIFGDAATIEFDVPDPGVLDIDVQVAEEIVFNIAVREIVENEYVYHTLITTDGGDEIMGQGIQSSRTQDEMNALIAEVAPIGIITTCTLTVPEP